MSDCEWYQLTCHLGSLVDTATEAVTDAVVSTWARAVLDGLDAVMTTLGTFWVQVPTPDVTTTSSVAAWTQSVTAWLVVVLAACSTITACVLLMWYQRGEEVRSILRGLLTLLMVSASGVVIGQAVLDVSDASATWFLDRATEDPGGNFTTKLLQVGAMDPTAVTLIVAIVLGLVGLLANVAQIGMMFARSAMVVLLLAALPVAAASTMTQWGQQWLRKTIAWFFAFAAMKPVAALVYAIAIRLVKGDSYSVSGSGELLKFMLGVIMMILAAFSLPALVAFIVPAAGAVGGGGGAGALVGGAGAVATGAVAVSQLRGAAGGSGPSGAGSAPGRPGATSSPPPPGGGGAGAGGAPAAGGSPSGASPVPAPGGGRPGATSSPPPPGGGGAGAGGSPAAGGSPSGAGPVPAPGGAVGAAASGVRAVAGAAERTAQEATGSQEVSR